MRFPFTGAHRIRMARRSVSSPDFVVDVLRVAGSTQVAILGMIITKQKKSYNFTPRIVMAKSVLIRNRTRNRPYNQLIERIIFLLRRKSMPL